MRNEILANLHNAQALEKLYRDNKSSFKRNFNDLYPEISEYRLATFWNERLNFEGSSISWGGKKELGMVIMLSLLAGFLAKIPNLLGMEYEFYQRNWSFMILPILGVYFYFKKDLKPQQFLLPVIATLFALVFVNMLPDNRGDTLLLSFIHTPFFLWAILGFVFIGGQRKAYHKRIDFLRFNGELLVLSILILGAGMLLTGMTFALFSAIGMEDLMELYMEWIVVFGLFASPIVATYISQNNPETINKVLPIIAKVFSPLVLITLICYLGATLFSGKDPYHDRDFLIIFNLLLIGVMGIVLFSIIESFKNDENRINQYILLALASVTIVINGIALSAILYRLIEGGITPNRLAVLGGNILMITNLIIITFRLFRTVRYEPDIQSIEYSIAMFLPMYSLWTIIVAFLFPLIFGFR